MEGQIRVLKDALETRLGVTVASNHNILAWVVEFAGTLINRYEVGHDGKTPYERLRGKSSRLLGLEFGELVNFRRTPVGNRLAKLDSLWSDGVFLGYKAVSGEMIIGTAAGVFRTRTVKRKALEHRWHQRNLDFVGGVPWRTSPEQDEAEEIMPAVDIGMEMPEVDVQRPALEERERVPRRLYIRSKDITKFGATVDCKGCVATLRGAGGVPHSDSCRKRLTEEIARRDEGNRVQRARQRELEFYEKAIRDTDEGGTKRKNEEHDLDQREAKRRNEEVPIMRDVDHEGRGQKRPAEGSADESRDSNETEGDVQMDLVDISFAAYEEYGGLRMVACREPEEDMRESDEQFQEEDEGDEDWCAGGGFKDDRTGKALDPTKVRAAREEELKELDRRVWVETDVQECWDKKGRAPIGVRWVDVDKGFGVYRSRLVAKDFRPPSRVNDKEGLFAATPLLELVKMVITRKARNNNSWTSARPTCTHPCKRKSTWTCRPKRRKQENVHDCCTPCMG